MQSELWNRWEDHYKSIGIDPSTICRDGIINDLEFDQETRLMIVLKETNKFSGSSLSDLLKNGAKYQMWHTVGRWAAGILFDFPKYEAVNQKSHIDQALSKIAVINLKKAMGRSRAKKKEIESFAFQDENLLLEQIQRIRPKIILACGTFEPLTKILAMESTGKSNYLKVPFSNEFMFLVIPFRHPNRANNRKTYEYLRDIFKTVSGNYPEFYSEVPPIYQTAIIQM